MTGKLIYCSKHVGNHSMCSGLAKYKRTFINKKGNKCIDHMCEKHQFSKQADKTDMVIEELNQSNELIEVNNFLKSFIEKPVQSKFHNVRRPFIGKFIKDNGAIMCQNEQTKRWYCVYYNQIIEGEPHEKQKS